MRGNCRSRLLAKCLFVVGIIHADAQDPGVQALIEIQISIVRLHLARSGRGEGGREERHDQMVLPVVVLVIIHQPVFGSRAA